jgi:hypothetical protein
MLLCGVKGEHSMTSRQVPGKAGHASVALIGIGSPQDGSAQTTSPLAAAPTAHLAGGAGRAAVAVHAAQQGFVIIAAPRLADHGNILGGSILGGELVYVHL